MIVLLLKIIVPFLIIFQIIPLLIWLERKGSAYIQDRRGPNRASIMGLRLGGLIHSLSDVIKLMTKEDIIPDGVNRFFYHLAPFLSLFIACVTFAVIPFAHPLQVGGSVFSLQAADLNVGILYMLALSSLGVYGVMLAGWSSNNKYALLGGVRSSAQMLSYELSLGLSLISVLMMVGSFQLNDIAISQTQWPWMWYVFKQPLAFIIFTTAAFAETNRNPFDLPEGESELVAGYHTEYSSMKFAMFFMAEYAHMIIASAMIATLFFGGWQVPFLSTETLRTYAGEGTLFLLLAHAVLFIVAGFFLVTRFKSGKYGDIRDFEVLIIGAPLIMLGAVLAFFPIVHGPFVFGELGQNIFAAVAQFMVFMAKVLFFCWVFIWVRWTLPRFRFDQLMHLGWKVMLPLALANMVVTAVIMAL